MTCTAELLEFEIMPNKAQEVCVICFHFHFHISEISKDISLEFIDTFPECDESFLIP